MDAHQSVPEPERTADQALRPSGKTVGPIPRGIEVLVKKAAVDPEFEPILLDRRAKAADEIGLKLEPAEVAMLNAVPAEQLETIIANTKVSEVTRAAFLGRAAAVMLAALGAVSAQGCSTRGVKPDRIPTKGENPDRPERVEPTDGSRPDLPPQRPAAPPATVDTSGTGSERPLNIVYPRASFGGVRPDRPPEKKEQLPDAPSETGNAESKE